MLVHALLLSACASGPAAETGAAPEVDAGVEPVWSVQDMADAVLTMTREPAVSTLEVRSTYLDLMRRGDTDCPGSDTQLVSVTLNGCTADTGYFYAGVSVWTEQTTPTSGWRLSGDFEIIDPEGRRFIGGGAAGWQIGADALDTVELSGTWSYPGATTDWLDTGVSAYWRQLTSVDGDRVTASLEGGLSYAGVSLWTDAWHYDSAGCAQPMGAFDVRDPSGLWFHLDYGDDCDAGATVTVDGAPMGEVELDLGPWMRALAVQAAPA